MDTIKGEAQFGLWLKEHRRQFDLTQEELAMRVDCSWETIRKIEAGVRRPSKQVAELLAEFFQVPTEERPAFVQFARSGLGNRGAFAGAQTQSYAGSQPPLNNLPGERTTFVGREAALAAVRDLLLHKEVRLVTLFGPPGIGKTRLSLQVAATLLSNDKSGPEAEPVFRDGIFFVPLASVTNPSMVTLTIMQSLGVKETPGLTLGEHLTAYLRDRRMLLVLDNFEQVVQARDVVADLLVECPCLKVLATSREVLRVYGEHQFPVPPMSLPNRGKLPIPEVLESYEAIRLFVDRAMAVHPSFALTEENALAVAEICDRLDALPLAIELAATRVNILSPQAILARLGNRLDLLTTGARDLPARQRTLRDAIAWSYDILNSDEQALFRGLGVVVGGCTLEAAEAVVEHRDSFVLILDCLSSMADKSLLRQEEAEGEPRFVMLPLIREYALERLVESGEEQITSRRHALHFLGVAEAVEPYLTSGERALWIERLDEEQNNLRAALEWSISPQGDPEIGLRLAGSLGWYWYFRSHLSEGCEWFERVLSCAPASERSVARAKTLSAQARLAMHMGRFTEARPWLEESVEICRQMGDRRELAYALALLGLIAVRDGEHAMISLCEESVALFQEAGDKWGTAYALEWLADATTWTKDYARTEAILQESLQLYRELGDQSGISAQLRYLGALAELMGEYLSAIQYYEEAVVIDRSIGDQWNLSYSIYGLALTSHFQGYREKARALYEEALSMYREIGIKRGVAGALRLLGHLACDEADYKSAIALMRESLSLARQLDNSFSAALCLAAIGGLASIDGKVEQTVVLFGAANALKLEQAIRPFPIDRLKYEEHLANARDTIGEDAFVAAWERGRAMSLDDAVEFASVTISVWQAQAKRPVPA
ncbi:MAG TPA: tetratricopeptide repeat protein [Chloroflexia bacterium]|jgi:predicted ATPase/DNA-binding XRE family transcriptional regulator